MEFCIYGTCSENILYISDILRLWKYQPHIHTRHKTICYRWGCPSMSGPLQALLCILYSILAPSQRLSNCCLIRLSEQMPVHSMQLEVCSLMASTPDGACKLQLEEMQSKTAPCREAHNSFYLFCYWKRKVKWCVFPREASLTWGL